ncbi:MAG: hypothetical protein H6705_14140 [Myxococcales bacterium]|nr:hypothetical protein [Myxococcales bacterium]
MDCQSCHASWINQRIGCHLATHDVNPANYFSATSPASASCSTRRRPTSVYQNPVNQYRRQQPRKIMVYAGQKVWRFVDLTATLDVFFSDRLGEGNNPALGGRNDFPANASEPAYAHSILWRRRRTERRPELLRRPATSTRP